MNIVVLAGGISPEREVSLVSGSQIAKAMINCGHKVCLIDLCFDIDDTENLVFTDDIADVQKYTISKTAPDGIVSDKVIGKNVIEACRIADAVYLALHGDVGENGKLQALLTLNNIKYTGSRYDGCCFSMNKNISKLIAKYNGIKTAEWCMNEFNGKFNFPCVVKPVGCGSSVGITIVHNMPELYKALALAKRYDSEIIIEEYIVGREFSVGILDNRPLPPIEIEVQSGFYDYNNKYQGKTKETCPAKINSELTEKLQSTALKMHNLLHLKYYSRIDFIVDKKGEIYFLEANSLPGMTPTSLLPQEAAAVGIDYDTLCNKIINNAF